jgi:tetratricopeptide (TPR) repeat protein
VPDMSAPPQSAQDYFDRATRRTATEIDAKIADYTEAIRLDPVFARAYARRGGAHLAKGALDAGIADCDMAIRLDPALPDGFYNRAIARTRKGDYAGAVEDYSAAIALDPENARLYLNRGAAHNHLGQLDRAIEDYTAAITRKPDFAEAYFNRSIAYSNTDNFEGAIEDFARALGLSTKAGTAEQIGFAGRPSKGNPAETVAYLEGLLRRWPDHPQAGILRQEIVRLNRTIQPGASRQP